MHLRTLSFIATVMGLMGFLLGCAFTPTPPTIPATQAPIVVAPSPTTDEGETIFPQPTQPLATETVAPTPTATRTRIPTRTPPAVARCTPVPLTFVDSPLPLPDLTTLQWENAVIEGQSMRWLKGLSLEAIAFTYSPNGHQVAVALRPYRSPRGAIALLDRLTGVHGWIAQEVPYMNLPQERPPLVQWLPTHEAIWVDTNGVIRIGTNGSHVITPPVPMLEVAFVVDSTAFVISRDDRKWWRLEITTEQWEQIQPTEGLTGMGADNYSALATDKSYIFMLRGMEVWLIPTAMGGIAEAVPIELYDVVGSGQAPSAPVQFGTSPYWLIRLPIYPTEPLTIGTRTLFQQGFVVDLRDGSTATLAELAIPAPYDFVSGFILSADRQWVAMVVVERASAATGTPAWATYIAPTKDLAAGQLIEDVEAIRILEDPSTLIVREIETGILWVHPLPFADTPPRALENTKELLTTTTNRIYARATNDPTRILAFDAQGNLLNSLALSPPYNGYSTVAAQDDTVLINAIYPDTNEDCLYDIVEWAVP